MAKVKPENVGILEALDQAGCPHLTPEFIISPYYIMCVLPGSILHGKPSILDVDFSLIYSRGPFDLDGDRWAVAFPSGVSAGTPIEEVLAMQGANILESTNADRVDIGLLQGWELSFLRECFGGRDNPLGWELSLSDVE